MKIVVLERNSVGTDVSVDWLFSCDIIVKQINQEGKI